MCPSDGPSYKGLQENMSFVHLNNQKKSNKPLYVDIDYVLPSLSIMIVAYFAKE